MYRVMIITSVILGLSGASLRMKKAGVPRNIILYSMMLSVTIMFYLGFFITFMQYGKERVGLNSSGGAIGIILGAMIFSFITPEYRKDFFSSYLIMLPLMYGVGKIGCAFGGCCAGRPYSGIFHVHTQSGDLFPVQILEAVVFIGVFLISVYLDKKGSFDPIAAAIIYSLIKAALDFFRDTHNTQFITLNQILCLGIATFLGIFLIIARKKRFC